MLPCKSTFALCYIYISFWSHDLFQKGVPMIVNLNLNRVFLSGVPVHELTTNVKSTPLPVLYCLLYDNNMTRVTIFNSR